MEVQLVIYQVSEELWDLVFWLITHSILAAQAFLVHLSTNQPLDISTTAICISLRLNQTKNLQKCWRLTIAPVKVKKYIYKPENVQNLKDLQRLSAKALNNVFFSDSFAVIFFGSSFTRLSPITFYSATHFTKANKLNKQNAKKFP